MAHAVAADLTARYDSRVIQDLASDTGTPVSAGDLADNDNVTAALEDASGRMDAAVLTGKMYTPDQLSELTGNSLALRRRICCDLALAYLMGRRAEKYGAESLKAMQQSGEEYLERLRKGERLFYVVAVQDAQLPEIDGPSVTQYRTMNLIPDRTKNFYPSRASRLPTDRS